MKHLSHFAWVVLLAVVCVEVTHAQSTPAISAGNYFTVVLKSDGTVWTWGEGSDGELGNGTSGNSGNGYFVASAVPVQTANLSNVTQIASGAHHTLAIKSDGTLWSWGSGADGKLGNGSTSRRASALPISGMSDVIDVATGVSHSLAVKSDGSVWAWGSNEYQQLGQFSTSDKLTPVSVSYLSSNVIAVAAGEYHSIALKDDGTVWAWGKGSFGDGTTRQSHIPAQVPGLTGVIAIASGATHNVALLSDGTLMAWGYQNSYGQSGDVTSTQALSPVPIPGLDNVTKIVCGYYNTIAVKSDGSVWALGNNSDQQFGGNATSSQPTAIPITNIDDVVAAAGGHDHSILLKDDGTLVGLGSSKYGQLGSGESYFDSRLSHSQKFDRKDIVQLSAGTDHQILLTADGNALIWGYDASTFSLPLLPSSSIFDYETLTALPSLSDGISRSAAGYDHSLFLTNSGEVWALGRNDQGQLGDGTLNSKSLPFKISTLSNITAIAAGEKYSLALDADHRVWSWGYNNTGQLGLGFASSNYSPANDLPELIDNFDNVVAVSAGAKHSLSLKTDGTVWAWGYNYNGQLGDGTTTLRTSPVQIQNGLSNVIAIAADDKHSLALKADGTVWAWGSNTYGQLGDGTTTQRTLPIQVQGSLSDVIAIAAGYRHSLALKDDGTVWAWGYRSRGQIGDGNNSGYAATPVQVPGLTGVVAIAASSQNSIALKSDGTIRIWGREAYLPTLSRAVPAIILADNINDTDADGMPDAWEIEHFSSLSALATDDADYDGVNNIGEYANGTDPNQEDADQDRLTDLVDPFPSDFYNGDTALITIIGGDDQSTEVGQFNALPLEVAVWDSSGATPFVDAPVTFDVLSGGGLLVDSNIESPDLANILLVRTDIDGVAQAYYRQPLSADVTSQIQASASTATISFTSTSFGSSTPPVGDSDGNGLPDVWELAFFTTSGVDPAADADGDGMTNLQEYQQGRNPTVGVVSGGSVINLRVFNPAP